MPSGSRRGSARLFSEGEHPVTRPDVVITGVGTLSPLGIGREAFTASLRAGRSGIGPITLFDSSGLPVRIAGEVKDFDPKTYVTPRKSLKLMARDCQLGVAASVLACADAQVRPGSVAPDRFGVVLGADSIGSTLEISEEPYRRCVVDGQFRYERWAVEGAAVSFPLNFLKVLPNMIASHISIAHDARGPNNTIHHGDVSSLLALCEAARAIQRGAADAMLAGGASSQMNPFDWVRHCLIGRLSPSREDPQTVMRPFDLARSGQVHGEGSTVFVLERREHAEARGANIRARIAGSSSVYVPAGGAAGQRRSIARALAAALADAGLAPRDVGHVNAHGLSTAIDDAIEAAAIREVLGAAAVTAPKSYFGNLGAAAGATEMLASLLAIQDGSVPPTLNYRNPDPRCDVNIVRDGPLKRAVPNALLLNATFAGQATALVLSAPN